MKRLILLLWLIPSLAIGQLWSDNFEDSDVSDWTFEGGGNWNLLTDQSICLDQSSDQPEPTAALPLTCPVLSDYLVKAKVKITSSPTMNSAIEILARHGSSDICFGFALNPQFHGLYINDGYNVVRVDSVSYSWHFNTWYNVLVFLKGDYVQMKVWEVGSIEPGTYQLGGVVSGWESGPAGLRVIYANARYDDIEIHEIPDSIPSLSGPWLLLLVISMILTVVFFYSRRNLRSLG